MKEIKVLDIIRECNGTLLCGNENIVCKNFSKDTRTINEGDVYIGIKGERVNGNLLYKDAFDKGASVCILDEIEITREDIIRYGDKAIIKVDNSILAIQKLAKYKRSLYNIPVIGITGSVGKTSTKDIIASVVGKKYNVLKTEGNLNNEIGMPLTILRLDNHDAMVLEMGTDKFGDLSLLTDIANPNIYVFTIIGTSHIANFGSRENILKGKLELLESKAIGDLIVMNNDNDMLHNWLENNKSSYIENGYNINTYGIEEKNSDYLAQNVVLNEFGSKYNINLESNNYLLQIPVGGKHFVYNSLAAIAIGKYLNIDINEIISGIKEFELTKMRMDITQHAKNVTIINDTYNASYESMSASIEYISKLNNRKKLVVLGDMLELGEYSEELHRKVGRCVAQNNINMLITVGNESKNIAEEAVECGMKKNNTIICSSNEEASEYIKENVLLEDIAILVKASRGMQLEKIVEAIKNSIK